jgi:hypothetical protein
LPACRVQAERTSLDAEVAALLQRKAQLEALDKGSPRRRSALAGGEAQAAEVQSLDVPLMALRAEQAQRQGEIYEQEQRESQQGQDGSEVASVELERLLIRGRSLIDRRDALEHLRDQAVIHYERHTAKSWRPRHGSLVNHRAMTASLIDSREFLNARRHAETSVLLPPGPKIGRAHV